MNRKTGFVTIAVEEDTKLSLPTANRTGIKSVARINSFDIFPGNAAMRMPGHEPGDIQFFGRIGVSGIC